MTFVPFRTIWRRSACLAAALSLAGCGSSEPTTATDPAAPPIVAPTALSGDIAAASTTVAGAVVKVEIAPEDLEKGKTLVTELLGPQIEAAHTAVDRAALANKMIRLARETNDNPGGCYALLSEAQGAALRAQDIATAREANQEILKRFTVNPTQTHATFFKVLAEAGIPVDDRDEVLHYAVDALNGALTTNDFAAAEQLAVEVERAWEKTPDPDVTDALSKYRAELKLLQAQLAEYDAAVEKASLATAEREPILYAARYAAVRLHDWTRAEQLLSRADEPALADLLARERTVLIDPLQRLPLADAWWNYAGTLDGLLQQQAKMRAADHYGEATLTLTGLSKLKAEERYQSITRWSTGVLPDLQALRTLQQRPLLTNSIGMKVRLIPYGNFQMGSPPTERMRSAREHQHAVQINKPFYIGVYEVTQKQYEDVMGENPSQFAPSGARSDDVAELDPLLLPVDSVSWIAAMKFCELLSARPEEREAGRTYRLPSEAEWEYACRAGTTTPFSFGSELNGKDANCNGRLTYGTPIKGPELLRPTLVGSYAANDFGLYDMHGNVAEWCDDWYDETYYLHTLGIDPEGPPSGSLRIIRGGTWNDGAYNCRAAYRSGMDPARSSEAIGFRVVMLTPELEKMAAPPVLPTTPGVTVPGGLVPGVTGTAPTSGTTASTTGSTPPSTTSSPATGTATSGTTTATPALSAPR